MAYRQSEHLLLALLLCATCIPSCLCAVTRDYLVFVHPVSDEALLELDSLRAEVLESTGIAILNNVAEGKLERLRKLPNVRIEEDMILGVVRSRNNDQDMTRQIDVGRPDGEEYSPLNLVSGKAYNSGCLLSTDPPEYQMAWDLLNDDDFLQGMGPDGKVHPGCGEVDGSIVHHYIISGPVELDHPEYEGRVDVVYPSFYYTPYCDPNNNISFGNVIASLSTGKATGFTQTRVHSLVVQDCAGDFVKSEFYRALNWVLANGQRPGIVTYTTLDLDIDSETQQKLKDAGFVMSQPGSNGYKNSVTSLAWVNYTETPVVDNWNSKHLRVQRRGDRRSSRGATWGKSLRTREERGGRAEERGAAYAEFIDKFDPNLTWFETVNYCAATVAGFRNQLGYTYLNYYGGQKAHRYSDRTKTKYVVRTPTLSLSLSLSLLRQRPLPECSVFLIHNLSLSLSLSSSLFLPSPFHLRGSETTVFFVIADGMTLLEKAFMQVCRPW